MNDALAQAAMVQRGDCSPLELVDDAIARIEASNPTINAVIHERFERARDDARRVSGGPFRGVPVAAGTSVALSVMSANRDDAAYDDPDDFRSMRYDSGSVRPHLTFGRGSHFCLGNAIARVEMLEVLDVVLSRHPDLEVLVDRPEWVPYLRVRRFEDMPVRLGDPR